ncbi:transposable element Tc1 transposase [Trichonephila clavipes]|nr:transposable element Tc1 transposase [Trichonephila clavipes]
MFWADITLDSHTLLHVFKRGTVSVVNYRDEVLEFYVNIFKNAVDPYFLLNEDNARPQRSHLVDEFLEMVLVLFVSAVFLDGCCISFKLRAKVLCVDNLDKFVLLCRELDLVAHGSDWEDSHKWSFENGRTFVISLFWLVVQHEISSLVGMGSETEIKSWFVL